MTLIALTFILWFSYSAATSNALVQFLPPALRAPLVIATSAAPAASSFLYNFNAPGRLPEASKMEESWSPYWWVNSGGYLVLRDNVGMTVQGELPLLDPWRVIYAVTNPTDTDNGTHPQNIFRLVSRSNWTDVRIEARFKINADNFSASPNRNASNGLLLMSRYGDDGQTLYYAGVRVDGTAVIKKKNKGAYTTLAQKQLYTGSYAEGVKVNLLPHGAWIHLRSETVTNKDGSVTVRLFVKNPGENDFTKVLEAEDTHSPVMSSGFIGIRTDFMDVAFENFRAERL